MNPPFLTTARTGPEDAAGERRTRAHAPQHRFATPSVREMTRTETEAQRRLVRASVLAKPI